MIMCTGFNCIPCMALSSVLVTPPPFYELSPDTVRDVFYVLSQGRRGKFKFGYFKPVWEKLKGATVPVIPS